MTDLSLTNDQRCIHSFQALVTEIHLTVDVGAIREEFIDPPTSPEDVGRARRTQRLAILELVTRIGKVLARLSPRARQAFIDAGGELGNTLRLKASRKASEPFLRYAEGGGFALRDLSKADFIASQIRLAFHAYQQFKLNQSRRPVVEPDWKIVWELAFRHPVLLYGTAETVVEKLAEAPRLSRKRPRLIRQNVPSPLMTLGAKELRKAFQNRYARKPVVVVGASVEYIQKIVSGERPFPDKPELVLRLIEAYELDPDRIPEYQRFEELPAPTQALIRAMVEQGISRSELYRRVMMPKFRRLSPVGRLQGARARIRAPKQPDHTTLEALLRAHQLPFSRSYMNAILRNTRPFPRNARLVRALAAAIGRKPEDLVQANVPFTQPDKFERLLAERLVQAAAEALRRPTSSEPSLYEAIARKLLAPDHIESLSKNASVKRIGTSRVIREALIKMGTQNISIAQVADALEKPHLTLTLAKLMLGLVMAEGHPDLYRRLETWVDPTAKGRPPVPLNPRNLRLKLKNTDRYPT